MTMSNQKGRSTCFGLLSFSSMIKSNRLLYYSSSSRLFATVANRDPNELIRDRVASEPKWLAMAMKAMDD